MCAGQLRRGMVYELERMLRVCDGFFCSMSAIYDGALLIISHHLVPHLTRVCGWSGELLRQAHTHRPYICMSHHLVPHLTRVCGWSGELLRQTRTQTLHLHEPPFGSSLDKGVWLEWRTTAANTHTQTLHLHTYRLHAYHYCLHSLNI